MSQQLYADARALTLAVEILIRHSPAQFDQLESFDSEAYKLAVTVKVLRDKAKELKSKAKQLERETHASEGAVKLAELFDKYKPKGSVE